MRKTIEHLPKLKQDELAKIIATIRQNCTDVEKIILFGSYARGDYKEKKDLAENRKSGHVSDYDILVITKDALTALDTNLWHEIGEKCRNLKLSADPRILTHDIEELNNKLSVGQYFYSDIKEEGIVIFDAGNFDFADRRNLSDEEIQKFRTEYFEHWFRRAEMFFDDFGSDFKKSENDSSYFGKAAFDLHQSAEHAYKTLLLVFTLYNPNEHFLAILGAECEQYFPELRNLFPRNTEEEKERFKLLEYAYIGGRYDPKYKISKEDLEALAKDVKDLLKLTNNICRRKISEL
ncbi:MAG: HEPN domain-containing protein [Proteobacteria bacterium]|nr:HEPN domain-containing protein [Pseudomonadota bacterium]NCA27660.1 HEPN domain-containing protein [Pseudomonadota bacterium]